MNIVKAWTGTSLIIRITGGLVLGVILALLFPKAGFIAIFGDVFVSSLKAIAPILVGLLVTSSIARAEKGHGKRFRNIIAIYLFSTLMAACVSVAASFLFPVTIELDAVGEYSAPSNLADIFSNLLTSVVANPIKAMSDGNYLGVLFWAVVLGLALKKLASEETVRAIANLGDACTKMVSWIIQFAPFGIMGLVYSSVTGSGMAAFVQYGRLLLVLVGCMLTMALVVNPIIVGLMIRKNPYPLVFMCLKHCGINAFFTRSSAANIPVNLDFCRRLGLDKSFYSVSIPLGSTINMSGAAVTITVLSLAVCHTLGIEVGAGAALLLSVVAAIGACGASGVAGGSLLLVPMACSLFGISQDIAMQAVAVGFIIGVVQDSVETALNSSSDALFTAAVLLREKRSEGASPEE